MPYIAPNRRPPIDKGVTPENAGDLNYALTTLVLHTNEYDRRLLRPALIEICERYLKLKTIRYQIINDVIGACFGAVLEMKRRTRRLCAFEEALLMSVASEFYDRNAGEYEDAKRAENGDIEFFRKHC